MDFNTTLDYAQKASTLNATAILIVILVALAWFIYRENEDRKSKDLVQMKLADGFDRMATALEHQNKFYDFLILEIEHHRVDNARIEKIGNDVVDIKNALLTCTVTFPQKKG